MIAPHTFELSLDVDGDTFYKWLDRAKGKKTYNDDDTKDYAHVKEGVTVWFPHKDGARFKKKIKLVVNPSRMLGRNDVIDLWKPKKDNIAEVLDGLDGIISDYFHSKFELNDFSLSRIDFASNIRFQDPEMVGAYIKVLYNIRKVKGFSPKYGKDDDWYDDDCSFDLKANSKGVEFTAYDKAAAIKNQLEDSEWEYRRSELKDRMKMAKGLLRLEVKLTSKKLIAECTKATTTAEQLFDLCGNSKEVFGSILMLVVPYGDFHRKDKAVGIIQEKITDKRMKAKMLALLELVPKKKSLHLAIKELDDRKIEKIMEQFAAINLSPVTISKRQNPKHLPNLWEIAFAA